LLSETETGLAMAAATKAKRVTATNFILVGFFGLLASRLLKN
jgi:hypothetical protein